MPLRFTERDSSSRVSLTLIVLLALSVLLWIAYSVEGATGPLHTVQNATGIVSSPIRSAGAGMQSAGDRVQGAIEDAGADADTLNALREQNQQLRQQVSELEEYRVRAQQLEEAQKLVDMYALDYVASNVIGMPTDSWNRVVLIDKGARDGVSVGMAVMGSSGLVGQVTNVFDASSEVRLLQDSSSGVAVVVQSSRAEGLVRGSIDGLLYLEGLSADAEVSEGDTLVTSGLGGGYARGLLVGTVVRIENTSGQSLRRIVVAPNSTVSALDELLVVKGVGSEAALEANASQDGQNQEASGEASQEEGSSDGEQTEGEGYNEDAIEYDQGYDQAVAMEGGE